LPLPNSHARAPSPSTKDAFSLAWPFLVWGGVMVIMYGASYAALGDVNSTIIAIKLGHQTLGLAMRVVYFAGEASLTQVGPGTGEAGWGGGRGIDSRERRNSSFGVIFHNLLGGVVVAGRPTGALVRIWKRCVAWHPTSFVPATPAPWRRHPHPPSQDLVKRTAMQAQLATAAATLDRVYSAHLYGGPTLPDALAYGSIDTSEGAVFLSPHYATLLFRETSCLRVDTAGCPAEGGLFYPATHAGLDPIVRRAIDEADLLANDIPAIVTPTNARWAGRRGTLAAHASPWDEGQALPCLSQSPPRRGLCLLPSMRRTSSPLPCHANAPRLLPSLAPSPPTARSYSFLWLVGNWDMHDGLMRLTSSYAEDIALVFMRERLLHAALLVVTIASVAAYFAAMLRPFVARVGKEGRRVAELLVQLPGEVDVETVVAALTGAAAATAGGDATAAHSRAHGAWGAAQGAVSGMLSRGPTGSAGGQTATVPLLGSSGGAGGSAWQQAWGDPGPGGGGRGAPRASAAGRGGPEQAGGDGMRRRAGAGRRVAPELE
jgi:hypothetical protein